MATLNQAEQLISTMTAGENLPLPVVTELRSLGYDVITIQEAGRGNQQFPDEKVLHLASERVGLS